MLTDYHVHLRPDDADASAERVLHRRRTPSATARPPSERGIAELGVSEHIYRFRAGARALATTRSGASYAHRRHRRLLRVRARGDRPAARDRGRLRPRRARTASASCCEARDWDYVVGSVHFIARRRRRPWTTTTSGAMRPVSADTVWTTLLRDGSARRARSGLFDILAHPDLVKVWGRAAAAAGRRPAPLLRARDGRDRRVRRRDRGVDRRAAQAGRRDLPGAARSSRCAWRPAARSRCRATRTARRTLGYRYDAGARAARRRSA